MKISTYKFLIFSDIGFMEIINFVQDNPRSRKITLPHFSKSSGVKSSGQIFTPFSFGSRKSSEIFPTSVKTFAVKKVSGPFSIRVFLMELGRGVNQVCLNIAENSAGIAAFFLILLALAGSAYGIFRALDYYQNFTGPLKIQKIDESEFETLKKLMNDFALECANEVDESGNLSDSGQNSNKVLLAARYSVPVTYQTYKVLSGDTIGGIARKFGLTNVSTLISVNDISNVRQLAAGQKLRIPDMDGIIYTVKAGDSLAGIVEKNKVSLKELLDVNDLSSDVLKAGQQLFLPGVSLDQKTLKNAMGDRFIIPISAKFRWSSPFGWREDPIAHVKSFHTGTDMACPTGTPILASMSGKVITTGVNRVYGNYVIIDHGNGYQTLYAHMSKIIASKGQWVSQGTRIGLVGSTGYSTGPHLHFTVYKNGKMVNPMTVLK